MKNACFLILLLISTSPIVFGQVSKVPPKGRPTEQQEIRGDKHIEKELQQQQLTAAPERLMDTSSAKTKGTNKQNMKKAADGYSAHAVRRNGSCHKKQKPGTQKN